MPHVKKLTRVGNSTALIIDRAILAQVDLTADSEVEVSVEKGAIQIRPHRSAADDEFRAAATRAKVTHRRALIRIGR